MLYGDNIQFIDSLCIVYGYNGFYENPKPACYIFVNNWLRTLF